MSGQRIAEVLTIAGFPLTSFYIDGVAYASATSLGTVQVQGMLTTVTQNLADDLIGYVEDTESGIVVARPDGTLDFLTRQWPIVGATSKTVQLTLDDQGTNPYLGAGFSAPVDDLDLWPRVSVTPANGIEQITEDTVAAAIKGWSTLRKTGTQQVTNNQALWLCQFLAHIFASPEQRRVESVSIDAATKDGAILALMITAGVWDKYALTRKPPNGSRWTVVGLIETLEHEFAADPGTWVMTTSLDPYRVRDVTAGATVAQVDGVNFPVYTAPDSRNPILI